MNINVFNQTDLASIYNLLSEPDQKQLFNFALFLMKKNKQEDKMNPADQSLNAVEDTWGSIVLPRHMLKYVAENKEIEYEF